jgi:solute:Na+ symporter, SSS family
MELAFIDWAIVIGSMTFFAIMAWYTQRYMKTTADFLAANRCAGRYLLTMCSGIASLGAISVVAIMQMKYKTGLAGAWWGYIGIPIGLLLGLTGWVQYRYRETRAMTMAQFFEMRYSRKFRVLAGIIMWTSGVINFGIFPAVGARFFMNYCSLPKVYHVLGIPFDFGTFPSLMALLLIISLYFTFSGGQIAVLVTDFLQSIFCNFLLLGIMVFLLIKFPLARVFDGLMMAPPDKSLLNPFDMGKSDFSPIYFLIGVFGMIFNRLAWQGAQGYQVSAKTPHEAKMAGILGGYRTWAFTYSLILIPLVAFAIMHLPEYAGMRDAVNAKLALIDDEQIRSQMLVPMTMTMYLPIGMLGAFAAVMFAAFVSTHDTYLHSWGSIFIQDVVMPFRSKPFSQKNHLRLLRASICGVAIFIFWFSYFYPQTQDILMFFAITGAIWLGGAGSVIVGGLYTRWGTTKGAYCALLAGTTMATTGIVLQKNWMDWYGTKFFLTGQQVFFFSMVTAWTFYIGVSFFGKPTAWGKKYGGLAGLLASFMCVSICNICMMNSETFYHKAFFLSEFEVLIYSIVIGVVIYAILPFFYPRSSFNLDKMLHRGRYSVDADHTVKDAVATTRKWDWKQALGITKEFTFWDKFIYGATTVKSLLTFALFITMATLYVTVGVSKQQWRDVQYYMLAFYISTSFLIAIWMGWGGFRDFFRMFRDLKSADHDESDDGFVRDHDYEETEEDIEASES